MTPEDASGGQEPLAPTVARVVFGELSPLTAHPAGLNPTADGVAAPTEDHWGFCSTGVRDEPLDRDR